MTCNIQPVQKILDRYVVEGKAFGLYSTLYNKKHDYSLRFKYNKFVNLLTDAYRKAADATGNVHYEVVTKKKTFTKDQKKQYIYRIKKKENGEETLQIFKIIKLIGQGGFNEVYHIHNIHTGNPDKILKIPRIISSKKTKEKKQKEITNENNLNKTYEQNETQKSLEKHSQEKTDEQIKDAYYTKQNEEIIKECEILSQIWANPLETEDLPFLKPAKTFFIPSLSRQVAISELGKLNLSDQIKKFQNPDFDPFCHWNYISQLINIILTLERLNLFHPDVKPLNIIMKDNKLKLIDLGDMQYLPASSNEPYTGKKKFPYTEKYYTNNASEIFKQARTNAETREAMIYRQRVAFAHTLYEMLFKSLANPKDLPTKNTNLALSDQMDVTKLVPKVFQNLLTDLLNPELPDLAIYRQEIIDNKAAKKQFVDYYDRYYRVF